MRKILVVDDDPNIAEVIEQYFDRPEYDVCTMLYGEKVPETVSRIKPDLILLDLKLPDVSGIEVLKNLRNTGYQAPVVIITGNVSAGAAMEAMKEGAYEYLPKPFNLDELGQLVDKLLPEEKASPSGSEPDEKGANLITVQELIGRSPEMLKIGKAIGQAALSDAPILLSGENGTGKELVARLIHQNSKRKDHPFAVLNCSYPSPEMLEGELFGTGDQSKRSGENSTKLGLYGGGTVLLEGIENMDLKNQGGLLRFLKSQQSRIQENRSSPSDIRVIASSSPDISEKVSQGAFMQELFYALRVISIHLPPLKERRSDIPLLAEYFLRKYCRQSNKIISHISTDATKLLMSYQWPGNVEELENNVYSAVVMCQGDQISSEHLPIAYENPLPVQLNLQGGEGDYSRLFLQSLESLKDKLFCDLKGKVHEQLVGSLEKTLISMALAECQGNQVKASDLLGISRNTLREKMTKFGLSKDQSPSRSSSATA
jgi:two-component system response regulator AtoC